jgi:hypothetical protein
MVLLQGLQQSSPSTERRGVPGSYQLEAPQQYEDDVTRVSSNAGLVQKAFNWQFLMFL